GWSGRWGGSTRLLRRRNWRHKCQYEGQFDENEPAVVHKSIPTQGTSEAKILGRGVVAVKAGKWRGQEHGFESRVNSPLTYLKRSHCSIIFGPAKRNPRPTLKKRGWGTRMGPYEVNRTTWKDTDGRFRLRRRLYTCQIPRTALLFCRFWRARPSEIWYRDSVPALVTLFQRIENRPVSNCVLRLSGLENWRLPA